MFWVIEYGDWVDKLSGIYFLCYNSPLPATIYSYIEVLFVSHASVETHGTSNLPTTTFSTAGESEKARDPIMRSVMILSNTVAQNLFFLFYMNVKKIRQLLPENLKSLNREDVECLKYFVQHFIPTFLDIRTRIWADTNAAWRDI